jgi:hypothetical protein
VGADVRHAVMAMLSSARSSAARSLCLRGLSYPRQVLSSGIMPILLFGPGGVILPPQPARLCGRRAPGSSRRRSGPQHAGDRARQQARADRLGRSQQSAQLRMPEDTCDIAPACLSVAPCSWPSRPSPAGGRQERPALTAPARGAPLTPDASVARQGSSSVGVAVLHQ